MQHSEEGISDMHMSWTDGGTQRRRKEVEREKTQEMKEDIEKKKADSLAGKKAEGSKGLTKRETIPDIIEWKISEPIS